MVDSVRLIQLSVHVVGWLSSSIACFGCLDRGLVVLVMAAWGPWKRRMSGLLPARVGGGVDKPVLARPWSLGRLGAGAPLRCWWSLVVGAGGWASCCGHGCLAPVLR